MASRVGAGGRVVSFEPHRVLFARLQENISLRKGARNLGAITPVQQAAADKVAQGELVIPVGFESTMGLAFVATEGASEARERIPIQLTTLDAYFPGVDTPAVMKFDTEGNEASVLAGAARLMGERRVRDIVFEDHGSYPTPAMRGWKSEATRCSA